MKPTTGFFMCALTHAAASSSSEPPISPMSTTASVSGSSLKRGRRSLKVVPMTGSPPIPTVVVVPSPAWERAAAAS